MGLHVSTRIHADESAIDLTRSNPSWAQFRNDVHLDAGDSGSLDVLITNGPSYFWMEYDTDYDVAVPTEDGPSARNVIKTRQRIKGERSVVTIAWDTDLGVTLNFGRVRSVPI